MDLNCSQNSKLLENNIQKHPVLIEAHALFGGEWGPIHLKTKEGEGEQWKTACRCPSSVPVAIGCAGCRRATSEGRWGAVGQRGTHLHRVVLLNDRLQMHGRRSLSRQDYRQELSCALREPRGTEMVQQRRAPLQACVRNLTDLRQPADNQA